MLPEASPIGLGVIPPPGETDTARTLTKAIINYLRHGMVYYHYVLGDIPQSGPGSGEYGPINHMFPITPVELGKGFVIGKERIVTAVAGTFQWLHDSKPRVLVFDIAGRQTEAPVTIDGKSVTIQIEDWEYIVVVEPGQ